MAPLSIKKIPSVGDKTYQILRNLGIDKVSVVQQMPVEMMSSVLGVNGITIWKRANGLDNPPLIPFHERKSISIERTFNKDTIDVVKLRTTIFAMAENLAYQLRRGEKLASCISVKIRYSDFNTYSKQIKIPYTSADHLIIPRVLELFDNLYQRRLLIRLVGVKISNLVSGNYQINLFDDTEEMLSLYNALDTIRSRYGDLSVQKAASIGAKSIGGSHNPFNGEPPIILAHRKQ
jgi:DNA polymerase-4